MDAASIHLTVLSLSHLDCMSKQPEASLPGELVIEIAVYHGQFSAALGGSPERRIDSSALRLVQIRSVLLGREGVGLVINAGPPKL